MVSTINEPSFVLAEGVASAEEIETGMKLGAIHPIGTAHARGPDRLDVWRVVNGGARQRISGTWELLFERGVIVAGGPICDQRGHPRSAVSLSILPHEMRRFVLDIVSKANA
jgi:hypothetical protein